MKLYRVFPAQSGAAERELGGPLHAPALGASRIDNPALYRVLYASDAPEGAIAEAFGRFAIWTALVLSPPPHLPKAVMSIATFACVDDVVVDLDDPHALLTWELRPSDVVTRDYERSRAWAARIFRSAPEMRGVRIDRKRRFTP